MLDSTLSDEEKIAYQVNVIELRMDSFRSILLLTTVVGWLWFSWASWPRSRVYELFYSDAWSISLLLLALAMVCAVLYQKHFYAAMVLFVVGLVALLGGLVLVVRMPEAAYLFVIPLIFSSVLLGQFALLTVAVVVGAMLISFLILIPALSYGEFVPAFATLFLTAVAVSISTRNLHIALAWTLNGYRHAHANELLARESKAELADALKSLDKAMSRLRRVNARLAQVSMEAEEARRLKQQFAQTISHELRTPLNLIAGFTETIIKAPEYYGGPLPPNYLRDLSVVYRNACHLQDLVNDVLDLARLETAYLSLQVEELDTSRLIREAVNMARSLIEGRGLNLDVRVTSDLPPIFGDGVRLKQVVLNLLKNAARFTPEGTVTVRAWTEMNNVIVAVSDTGIGIPEESLAHIFESFRQLENPMQRRTEGAGLGLAISQQLIMLHGGDIWVESAVGVGSTFYFSLPVRKVTHLGPENTLEISLDEAEQANAAQQKLLLVLTRSPSSTTLLSRYLADYRIVFISDPEQMFPAVQQLLPQVVLLDTGIDEVSLEKVDELAQATGASMAIITCELPGEERLRKQVAADGYLVKPITRQALWDMLRQFDVGFSNVLVVDEDRDFVRLIGRMLVNPLRTYNVTYAYNGLEALQIIDHTPPDLLLIDLHLPDMDGNEVIRTVRENPRYNTMRILVITAYEDTEAANVLHGPLAITRGTGWHPNEVMQWLQATLNAL